MEHEGAKFQVNSYTNKVWDWLTGEDIRAEGRHRIRSAMAADGSATQARVLSEQALKQRESAINRLENVAVVEDEARALDVFRPLFQEREMYFPFTLLTDDVAKTLKKNRKLVGPESVANGPFHVSEIFAALNLADLALVSAHHSSGHLSAAIPTYLSATDPSARDDLSVAAEALARLSAVNTTAASSAWVALASSAGTVARSAAIAACGPILGRLVVLNPPTPSRVPRPLAERAAAIANRIAELHTPNEAGAPREAVDGAGAVGALRHFVEGARGVDGAHGIFAAVAACEHLRQVRISSHATPCHTFVGPIRVHSEHVRHCRRVTCVGRSLHGLG